MKKVIRTEVVLRQPYYTIGIDPGSTESAYVIWDGKEIIDKAKVHNHELLSLLKNSNIIQEAVIEQIASYGMAVGETVFDTVFWSGRLAQVLKERNILTSRLKRKEIVTHLCGTSRAKDSNVIQALIDRFAKDTPNKGKGSKKDPGFFYGFSKDIWQAFAVTIAWCDLKKTMGDTHYVA